MFRLKVSITEAGAFVYYDVSHSRGGGSALIRQRDSITADSAGHYREHFHRFVVTQDLSRDLWEWRIRVPHPGVGVWADTVTVRRVSGDSTLPVVVPTTPAVQGVDQWDYEDTTDYQPGL